MTQSPKPSKSQLTDLSKPKTKLGKVTQSLLSNILEPLDLAGTALMGELWRDFYLTVQDAIALSLLLRIPSLIGHWIIDFIIVISDFFLWIFLGGRIIGRFWANISKINRTNQK